MEYKLSSFQFSPEIKRDDKHYAIMKINSIRNRCPYDSNFTGEFKHNGDLFSGDLRIHFSKGQFLASAQSTSMEALMDALLNEVEEQIEMWREVRFDQKETFIDFEEKRKKA